MRKVFIVLITSITMHHEILGELFQWLKIQLQSESVLGDHTYLLCRSEDIKINDNTFFGTGWLIFSGNGMIKEFYLHAAESIVIAEGCILATDITAKEEPLSTNYVSLLKVSGPGTIFVHGKDFVEFYIEELESIQVRTPCITALDSTITYDLDRSFSKLTGPGAVLLKRVAPEAAEQPASIFDQL
jgi:uncharacterized protein (AIM24 family)